MLPLLLRVLCASAVILISAASRADDTWTMTTGDFKRQLVTIKSLDDAGATVIINGQTDPLVLPWAKVLQFARGTGGSAQAAQQVQGTFTLPLVSGDRVGGEPVSIAND